MFRENNQIQQSIFDKVEEMPNYLKAALMKSWAHVFRENIFYFINEERFSVLYSNHKPSRPNTPINILIILLVIKELNGLTDEELIGSVHFDTRFQYALHTESLERQPVSINSFTNFRNRLVDYENETGVDLLKEEIEALSKKFKKVLKIDGKNIRMDSMMISSSCKKMSRLELVYSVIYKHIKELSKVDENLIIEEYKVYLKKEHQKEVIYQINNSELDSKLTILLKHAYHLYKTGSKNERINQLDSFKLLERLLHEQTTLNDQGIEVKAGKEITSNSLQNPSDPDATYRKKYKDNIGYVANIVEAYTVDEEKNSYGIITDYDVKQNIYSDVQFAKDYLTKLIDEKNDDETIEKLVDGGYFEQGLVDQAKENHIDMYFTNLVGKKPNKDKLSYTEFEINEVSKEIVKCPNNLTPVRSHFKDGVFSAHFNKETCDRCPLKANCPMKRQKKTNVVRFSEKTYNTEKVRSAMETKEYKTKARKRAGVEGIPSVLRRKYTVDKLPIRGLVRSKMHIGFKILAYNVRKLQKGLEQMA